MINIQDSNNSTLSCKSLINAEYSRFLDVFCDYYNRIIIIESYYTFRIKSSEWKEIVCLQSFGY